MKKINLITLISVLALSSTGAYAGAATFEEMLGGDSGSLVRGLNAAEPADTQKITIAAPEGMEICAFSEAKGDTCVFKCKSGATATRPRINSSIVQNGGCARFVIVPVPGKSVVKQNPLQAHANGKLYEYNSGTKKYDIDLNTKCSASVVNFKSYIDNDHGSPTEAVSADYKLTGFPGSTGKYLNGKAEGLSPNEDFRVVSLADYYKGPGLTSGVRVSITLNEAVSTQSFFSNPISITRVRITFENSAHGYSGGEAIKWGYLCEIR